MSDLTIEDHDLLDIFISELDKREADVPRTCWFFSDAYEGEDLDEGIDYCEACILKLRPDATWGEHYTGARYHESDGVAICEECGCLLSYTLTSYGTENELSHFEEVDSEWDWNNAEQCFTLARVAHSVWTDEQRIRLLNVLRQGENTPPAAQSEE
jgi:hypothetical protein